MLNGPFKNVLSKAFKKILLKYFSSCFLIAIFDKDDIFSILHVLRIKNINFFILKKKFKRYLA